MTSGTQLTVVLGDIHGRFHRVQTWLEALESARGRTVDLTFAVGDLEAFARADDHRRKAAKRAMPAEFAEYASGLRHVHRPLYFIGGNNEDFAALHAIQGGGDLAPDVHYLGRVGVKTLGGLKVGFLSGIHAPRFYDAALEAPRTRETSKQAGYFRKREVEALRRTPEMDILLVHEWPRGLFVGQRQPDGKEFRPWMGNRVTQELVTALHPQWLLCGHSHTPWAASVTSEQATTRVTCLDQAARPEGAVFWMEWEAGAAVRAGWGISGAVAWEAGQPWNGTRVPELALIASDDS